MGIKLKPGAGKAAEQELIAYIAAYPVNLVGAENGMLLFWLPAGREDEAEMFAEMQLNEYCGEFDLVKYFGKLEG